MSYRDRISDRLSRTTREAPDGREQCDRHVDEQRPAPRRELGEGAAEHEPDRGPATGDGSVDAEGTRPFTRLDEGRREQRQRGRRHDRGESALQGAGPEEHGRVPGQSAEGRGEGEADQTEDEGAAPADVVGDPAAEEQEAAEGQGVGGHHPLAVGNRDVEGPLGRRAGPR